MSKGIIWLFTVVLGSAAGITLGIAIASASL